MKKFLYSALGFAALFATSCKKNIEDQDVQKPLIISGAVDTLRGDLQ